MPVAASSQPQRSTTPTVPADPTVRFAPFTVPFTVGWLPAGWHEDGMVRSWPGDAQRWYENVRTGEEIIVRVWDTRLSGRPANEVLPVQGPTVRRQVRGTVWMAAGGPLSAADLNRLLRSVDVRHTEAIRFPFRATWLPAGYRPTSSGSGLRYWSGNAAGDNVAADEPLVDSALYLDTARHPDGFTLSIGMSTEDGSWQDKGLQPNGTLLGRPSRFTETNGIAALHVYDLRGMHLQVNAMLSGRPELNRAVLERIARGLRLVDNPDRPADWTDRPLP